MCAASEQITMNVPDYRLSFTIHAMKQFAERFPDCNIIESYRRSMPFAGQFGTDTMSIDETINAVFVATKYHVVRTVLTHDQAIANLQMSHCTLRHSIVSQACDGVVEMQSAVAAKAKREIDAQREQLRGTLQEFASRHATAPSRRNESERLKDIRLSGVGLLKADVKEYRRMYQECCRNCERDAENVRFMGHHRHADSE
jgi:hypothetical protein